MNGKTAKWRNWQRAFFKWTGNAFQRNFVMVALTQPTKMNGPDDAFASGITIHFLQSDLSSVRQLHI